MNLSHLAVTYAKALFEVALEQNSLEKAIHDMRLIHEVCHTNRDFKLMIKSPVIASDKKIKIIHAIFDTKLSSLTLFYLVIILRKNREAAIPDIAADFIELYKDYKGILTTYLTTTSVVSDDVRGKIIAILKRQTGKEIEMIEETNAEMIGGFILRWKDQQYDASILNQINKLKKEVAAINLYVKGF
jgi:F-type H+-transporting ATPase subunit delta